jgi:hypothetical protein
MSLFKRIIFGIFAALGLAVVVILTQQQVFNRVANELGGEAILADDFEFFISTRYYHKDPIKEDTVTFGDYTFDIKIYNVANIRTTDDKYDVVEGFQIILYQSSPPYIDMPFSAILTSNHETLEVEFQGYQISQLPVFVFLDVEGRSTFFSNNRFTIEETFYPPQTIEILHFGQIIGAYDLFLETDDFKLKTLLDAYLETNENPPTEAFGDVGYAVILEIDSPQEVIRNAVIYVVIILIIMYLLFIYRRKRLGRSEATEGLKKDVMKLRETKEDKR